MQFFMPVKVYQEQECVRKHPEVFAACGKKALLVTGRHSAKANGAYADVCETLDAQGISHVLFDEVEENPSIETVMKAREFGVREQVDFVVGIGGGSPLDAAKAVSLMIYHKDKGAEFLYGSSDPTCLPMVLIPTTCGTGSEVTPVSVLTIHAKKTKGSIPHKLYADYALLDGRYLAFASDSVLCNTAVDALGHLWESYLNTDATDYSRMCVDAGLKMWRRSKEVLRKGSSEDGRERPYTMQDYVNLLNASMFAGMAIAQDGTTLPHGLSYPLTYSLKMPHGAAVGYYLGGYLAEANEEDREYLLQTAGFESLQDWQNYYEEVCDTSMVTEEMLSHAAEVLGQNKVKLEKAPFPCDSEVLRRIAFWGRQKR